MIDDITVFDFETTGLDPEKDQVIEMAAIRCIKGEIVSSFSTLVQYDGILTPKITELTGIKQSDLIHGMTLRGAFAVLRSLMGNSTIIAHNAAFDLGFLHHTLLKLEKPTFTNSFIDTLTISRDHTFFPYKLTDMCDRYWISLEGAHRALADVFGCWKLLKVFYGAGWVDGYINELGYMTKYGPPKWIPSYAILRGQENKYKN